MVCLKQLSLTAVVALSLSETGLAAPVYAPIHERALEDRAIKNVMAGVRKHGGNAVDDTLAGLKMIAQLKSALAPQPQQRGLYDLDERSLEYLEDRALKSQAFKKAISALGKHGPAALGRVIEGATVAAEVKNAFFSQPQQPQRRSLEYLEDRALKSQAFKKVISSVGKHGPAALDTVFAGVTAAAEVKNAFFSQPQQPQRRSLEELEQRAFEDYIRELYF
ncbi:unnamed protein product [Clonostachys solani]|uniref:Uncharacterized protein n=1 Tax=Clonostachys solani TaxID=160281 RepID=A0A9N9W2W8_9HYPO|nr:unnamed protein product [Clonostachys solani]